MSVLDASAILAFLLDEEGAEQVEAELESGAQCSAANWSEVAQKSLASGKDWLAASALLTSYSLVIEPVTVADAEWAAARWRPGEGLSLGDRLCLALAHRLGVVCVTTDKAWGDDSGIHQLR
ncbi:MAG: type II toxin-antitoxin system VapC family toxin [Propionibacteriaceae bacterium]|jgi:PIN domain nuclease of toxin-antitoxin system|nr:type II toxin-antitoxin system VapC family toxin [Propionibacteriaceae bacterium]